MPTNMTILKSSEYFRICNVDDAKIIVIDQICICSKLTFQPESNKHRTREIKKHTAQKREIKTNKVVQRRRNHKNKLKKTENM